MRYSYEMLRHCKTDKIFFLNSKVFLSSKKKEIIPGLLKCGLIKNEPSIFSRSETCLCWQCQKRKQIKNH